MSSSNLSCSNLSSQVRGKEPISDTAQPRLELPNGVDAEAVPKGVDHKTVVWIGDLSFQGSRGEEIRRWEREERRRKALEELEELEADPEDPVCRVENLLWIKKNTFYKEALDDWKEQKNVQDAKISESQKREGELVNEIYNLIGFFSVFQGVILTAVTQVTQTTQSSPTPRPLCGKVWFPAVLSGLAAIAAVSGIGLKFRDLYKVKEEIFKCRRAQWAVESKKSKLERNAKDFLFREAKKREEVPFDAEYLLLKSLIVVAGVIVFTAVLIMSYVVIMCDKLVANWH